MILLPSKSDSHTQALGLCKRVDAFSPALNNDWPCVCERVY